MINQIKAPLNSNINNINVIALRVGSYVLAKKSYDNFECYIFRKDIKYKKAL